MTHKQLHIKRFSIF